MLFISQLKSFYSRGAGQRGDEIDHVSIKQGYYGSRARDYRVRLPAGYSQSKSYPLVILLHGCSQQHTDIQHISRFDHLADKHQFIVAYPFVTAYSGIRAKNCWGWWLREHIGPGRGESEDLKNIAQEIMSEYAVDHSRVHIAGLSSGAAMALAAMVTGKKLFASCAVVAGLSYGERITAVTLPTIRKPRYRGVEESVALMHEAREGDTSTAPLCVIHSHDDHTVDIQAARNLRDSWIHYFRIDKKSAKISYRHENGYGMSRTRYGSGWYKPSVLEVYFLERVGHGWSGGSPGEYSYPDGPDISKRIWKFFSKHRLDKL